MHFQAQDTENKVLFFLDAGGWSKWGLWTNCTAGTENRTRTRQCTDPAPLPGGAECSGAEEEEEPCPGKDFLI